MSNNLRTLVEQEISSKVQEAECVIQTSAEENLTDILTSIRAIAGVTIVNLVGSSKKLTEYKEIAYLRIKFVPLGSSTDSFIKGLVNHVRGLKGVYSFHIKSVENLKNKIARRKRQKEATKNISVTTNTGV